MARINYKKLPERECRYCKRMYKPTGPAQKDCTDCQKKLRNLDAQVSRDIARYKKFGSYERIGQGGNQRTGTDSPHYKNGIGYFHKISPILREEWKYCERCGKDVSLNATGKWGYALHHRDHDRSNNPEDNSNYELLCRRCHQIHHDCVDNLCEKNGQPLDDRWYLEGATTISEESTSK